MIPAWARLLRQYRKEGRFGLTPSFLVGAMRKPIGSAVSEEISLCELRSMMECMRNHPIDGPVRLLKCHLLQQPVAALDRHISSDEEPIPSVGSSEPKLFVAKKLLKGGPLDLDVVVKNLWSTFQRPLNEGTFSYREDEFHAFNEDDLSFVRRALEEDA